MKILKGILLVIDGIDGSGKTVQTKLLISRLRRLGLRVKTLDFPQYEKTFFGGMVRQYLSGDFGTADKVNPKLASLLYALDRWEMKKTLERWLRAGNIVVLNRYVTSNQIHQIAKLKTSQERDSLWDWLCKVEYGILRIPRPDLVIFLSVPPRTSIKLLSGREKRHSGRRDIHENLNHLEKAFKAGRWSVRKGGWKAVNCVDLRGNILSREIISEFIWKRVENFLKNKKSIRKN